jgi:ectoine hydroxylase-related dioxygenase (phytanoyl-CoA dioxygenase family)
MSIKEPLTGGAWTWHQDYGYWYNDGFLFPTLASCFIAVDANTQENGCMQLLTGSHRMGRINHGKFGDQTGADPQRTEAAGRVLPLAYAEMEPGDGLFFDCNLLHRSNQNKSAHPRWSLICCYNAANNLPYALGPDQSTEPIVKSEESAFAALVQAHHS